MKRGTWRDPEAGRAIATSPFKIGWDKAAALAAAAKERRALLDTTFEPVTASEAGSFIALLVAGRPRAFVNLVKIRTSPKGGLGWRCRACGRTGGFTTAYGGLILDDLESHSRTAETASAAFAMFVNRHNRCL